MPQLKNVRHEAFAVELAKARKTGKSQGQCYSSAGFNSVGKAAEVCASKLLAITKNGIKSRVQELTRGGARRAETTIASLLGELEHVRHDAHNAEQFSAAVSAITSKAKLAGLWVDKSEHGAPGEFAGLTTVEEILAKAEAELGPGAAAMLQAVLAGDERAGIPDPHERLRLLDAERERLVAEIAEGATVVTETSKRPPALAGPPAMVMTAREWFEWQKAGRPRDWIEADAEAEERSK